LVPWFWGILKKTFMGGKKGATDRDFGVSKEKGVPPSPEGGNLQKGKTCRRVKRGKNRQVRGKGERMENADPVKRGLERVGQGEKKTVA